MRYYKTSLEVVEHMGDTVQIMITMVVYMAAVIGIGLAFAKKANKSSEDYFLGGRSLGP